MTTTKTIDNRTDIIDSRDVIARIEELESERTDLADVVDSAKSDLDHAIETKTDTDDHEDAKNELEIAVDALKDWDESDEADELKALKALADEASCSPDWIHGEVLIRDSYFKEYAQELAEDCGMVKDNNTWPNRCIDWDQAADELKQDYMQVDFDGVEYWIRA